MSVETITIRHDDSGCGVITVTHSDGRWGRRTFGEGGEDAALSQARAESRDPRLYPVLSQR